MIVNSLILLPYDVLLNIVMNLNPHDLRNLMLTCKTLRDVIINENAIWKWSFRSKLILRDSSNSSLKPRSYYNQCRISNTWCKGIYRNKVIIQHHANYMPWLKLHNSEALFLSLRSSLTCYPVDRKGFPNCKHALWTLDVPKVLRNDVRTNDISRFVIKDNIVVCGNRDGSTTVYTYNHHQKPSLLYHIRDCHDGGQLEVSAVEYACHKNNPCVITASGYSSELSIWYWKWKDNSYDLLPHLEHHTFDCNTDPAHCIKMGLRSLAINKSQDKLAIGLNRNSKPLLLDINTCSILINADDTRNARQVVRDLQWHDEQTVVLVTHFGTLQLIDVRTNNVVYETTDPFQSSLYCVKSDGHRAIVVGSSEYSRCVLYDCRFKNHVQWSALNRHPDSSRYRYVALIKQTYDRPETLRAMKFHKISQAPVGRGLLHQPPHDTKASRWPTLQTCSITNQIQRLKYTHSLKMYFTQKIASPIYSLDFDSTKLIAAADRSTAALDFNVNVTTTPARDYSHTFEIVQNR